MPLLDEIFQAGIVGRGMAGIIHTMEVEKESKK